MKSIKELIKVSSSKLDVKKRKSISTEINWNNMNLTLDASGLRQLNKVNKWLQLGANERISLYKILFYGAFSVDKTKAVKTIAKQSGLDLYRIKLSEIVSKYIGETEKNIDQIFKSVKQKDWILFFDEADVLFGKRTNVRDAHDKYANQEISYLMQKLEAYKGLVIFNCRECDGLDKALAKYFQTVVHFPRPKNPERKR